MIFTTGGSQGSIVTRIVVNLGLGKHGKVFNLGSAKGRAVVADEKHLCLRLAHVLQSSLVSEVSLSGLHDQLDTGVHAVNSLLLSSENGERVRF